MASSIWSSLTVIRPIQYEALILAIQLAATTINGVQEVRVLFNMHVLYAREADGSTVLYLAPTMEGAQLPYCWDFVKRCSGKSVSVRRLVCVGTEVKSGL
jgi:hypothetical protein